MRKKPPRPLRPLPSGPPDPRLMTRVGPTAFCVMVWLDLEPDLLMHPEVLADRCGVGVAQLTRTFWRLHQFGYQLEGAPDAEATG